MIRQAAILTIALSAFISVSAQMEEKPMYLVNGVERQTVDDIPESNIESVEMIPVDEALVARYGTKANGGIVVIRLIYDSPAQFGGDKSFNRYVSDLVEWDPRLPVAIFSARYTIHSDGRFELGTTLKSTDRRLEHRVKEVLKGKMPEWKPATRDGKGVQTEGVLYVQLPEGRAMPAEKYIVIR